MDDDDDEWSSRRLGPPSSSPPSSSRASRTVEARERRSSGVERAVRLVVADVSRVRRVEVGETDGEKDVIVTAHRRASSGVIGRILRKRNGKRRDARGREFRVRDDDAGRDDEALERAFGIERSWRTTTMSDGTKKRKTKATRELLVIVNPTSGKGRGMKIWERCAAPTLRASGARCETRVTTRAKEATEILRAVDLTRYDGVVVVGGDGTVAEVFQGMRERGDEASTSTPLGVVPAGSGNALCKSIQHAGGEPCDPVSCALTIARGHTRSLDRAEIRFRDKKTGAWNETSTPTHSLLSTSWGFFSDVDIESEKFRFLGGARFTVQAIVRILSRRKYACDFVYETTASGREHNERHYADADLGVRLADRPGWRRISGDVLGLWALNVPWGTETTLAAPRAEFNDGSLDVVLVRVTNRKNMLKLMLDFDAGAHVSNRAVAYLKVKSFELIPRSPDGSTTTTGGGFIAVDGELAASRRDPRSRYGALRCVVAPDPCRVFAPRPT